MNFSGVSRGSLLGQILRKPLDLIPKSATMPVLQGPLRGKKWITGSSTHGCWLGSYEFEKQLQFSKQVAEGNIVYDVGAHVGFYTLLASTLVGDTGHVFAFEPFPPNMTYLCRHLELNRISNVTPFELALSNDTGLSSFEVAQSSSMGHLTASPDASGQIVVDVMPLDAAVKKFQLPPPERNKGGYRGCRSRFPSGRRTSTEDAFRQALSGDPRKSSSQSMLDDPLELGMQDRESRRTAD